MIREFDIITHYLYLNFDCIKILSRIQRSDILFSVMVITQFRYMDSGKTNSK